MYLIVCPFCGPGSIPGHGGVFQGIFSLADHTLPTHHEPAWQKMTQSPLQWHHTSCGIESEGLRPTAVRQWLKKKIMNAVKLG